MKRLLHHLPVACLLLTGFSAFGLGTLEITDIARPAAGQLKFTLQDTGISSTAYRLESTAAIGSGPWSTVSATFVPVAGSAGMYAVTIAEPDTAQQFYRIIGTGPTGPADDPDGDGLPTAFENKLGTNPNLRDTDGDGFSDGVEFAYGTNPLLASSKPDLASLPAIQFEVTQTTAVEGGGVVSVKLISDRIYNGPVTYAVNAKSTATAPADFAALSGTLNMNGTSASIVIQFNDDLVISPQRLMFLDVTTPGGAAYRSGGRSRHIVLLSDNDGYWNGNLKGKYDERNFRLKILRSGATTQAFFVAGTANDGLSGITGETVATATSISEGVVPLGSHAATVGSDSAVRFEIVSPVLTATTATTGAFGAMPGLRRQLTLLATPPQTGHVIKSFIIGGTFTEAVTVAGQSPSYLDRTMTGIFVLVPDLPAPPALSLAN